MKKEETEEEEPTKEVIEEEETREEESEEEDTEEEDTAHKVIHRERTPKNMDTIVTIPGGNPGGKAKYFLNDESTIKKLKAAADKANMTVADNNGSKTIDFSTGAYVSVVLPLIRMWQEMEGHPIRPEDVDGLNITVVKIEVEKELAGTIVKHTIELKVQGIKVKVTCYDTTLSMMVQSGKMLEQYCSRVLLPYLRSEITVLGRLIEDKNAQVRAYGEPRTTRNQQKEIRKGVASVETTVR